MWVISILDIKPKERSPKQTNLKRSGTEKEKQNTEENAFTYTNLMATY